MVGKYRKTKIERKFSELEQIISLEPNKKVILCDSTITSIEIIENLIRFNFKNGFFIEENNEIARTNSGCVEFVNGNADCFSCYILKRKPSKDGARIIGHPITLKMLYKFLKSKAGIEIFLEAVDFNHLHWRGVSLPYKRRGLSDHMTIDYSGPLVLRYTWT